MELRKLTRLGACVAAVARECPALCGLGEVRAAAASSRIQPAMVVLTAIRTVISQLRDAGDPTADRLDLAFALGDYTSLGARDAGYRERRLRLLVSCGFLGEVPSDESERGHALGMWKGFADDILKERILVDFAELLLEHLAFLELDSS